MEACLALARSLEVDLHTTESLDDGQNDKISSFTSHLLRLRAAQTQLLEVPSLRSTVDPFPARFGVACTSFLRFYGCLLSTRLCISWRFASPK
jgi:hypothetical protein